MHELDPLLALNAVPGLGNIRIRRLLEHFGSARKVWSAPLRELTGSNILPPKVASNISEFDRDIYLKKEYNLIEKYKVKVNAFTDRDYPLNLREIPDAPVVLYRRGNFPPKGHLAVAIVGSRRASLYGLSMAEKFASELSELGITVVSGMARGVDTFAHRGALKSGGYTAAVLGCGLAHIYPPENRELFEKISESGVVLSEFPMSTPPVAGNFPRRNRIISGLSLGVIVVEASLRSGALITSDFALEQGREVFAVPGKADNPAAQGVNNLIKQGAKLVTCLEDILEELKPRLKDILNEAKGPSQKSGGVVSEQLSKEEKDVYGRVTDEPSHIDVLTQGSASVSQTMAVLSRLELKRMIRQLPGKLFVRAGGSR